MVDSFDSHVVNPNFSFAAPDVRSDRTGGRASIVAQVTGTVQYGRGRDAPRQSFNEVFLLVPNWDAMARNPPKNLRRWLIMSQNFRTL